jgi:hypothetical protein
MLLMVSHFARQPFIGVRKAGFTGTVVAQVACCEIWPMVSLHV